MPAAGVKAVSGWTIISSTTLPAIGVVQVLVPDDLLDKARNVVADWEAGEVPDDAELDRLAMMPPTQDGDLLA